MAKNILAFFGMLFLTMLIVGGVSIMAYLYDSFGLVSLPSVELPNLSLPTQERQRPTIAVYVEDQSQPVWTNPLEVLPEDLATSVPFYTNTPWPTETPVPTATPVPPLDPLVYRTQTAIHLKEFAAALEGWLQLNQRAGADNALFNDQAWRDEMDRSLETISATAYALAGVGPEPAEYSGIAALLDYAASESDGLVWNYRQALQTSDPASFRASGEHFNRLKQYLAQAAQEMLANGWDLQ